MKLRRRILLTLVFGLVLLAALFWIDRFGAGSRRTEPSEDTKPSKTEKQLPVKEANPTEDLAKTDSAEHLKNIPQTTKKEEKNEMPAEDLPPKPTAEDTLDGQEKNHPEPVKKEAERQFNLIEVKKQMGKLVFVVNGKKSDVLLQSLNFLEEKKEVILKISGNITYAEGQQLKKQLEAQKINYTEHSD